MLTGIKLIIYDLDGVLIVSERGILETFKAVLEELKLGYDAEKLRNLLGYSLPDILKKILPKDKQHLIEKASQLYRQKYVPIALKETVLIEGVLETLTYFKSLNIKQSIATNKSAPEADQILKHLGILEYFELLVGFFDVVNPKPAPDMINLILEKLQVTPEDTVLIEDTLVGMTAGKDAGVRIVAVTTGVDDRETLLNGNPEYVIKNLRELKKLVDLSRSK
jgi:HAD superfamily hydrolase (TIGR01509 family)